MTKLRLNWFSPLPPLATEIGYHTVRLLPALTEKADVTLWTTQEHWDRAIEDLAPVKRWQLSSPPWSELNDADLNCYNIGNNPDFHGEMTEFARLVPGMVILHDVRLQGLTREYLPPAAYRHAMLDHYGPEGLAAALALDAGTIPHADVVERFPLTSYPLSRALAVVLHNPHERDAVAAQVRVPVFYLPLPFEAGPSPAPANRNGVVKIIQFGYLGKNRRLDKVLEALAGLPDKSDFSFDIYGPIWDRALVESWIHEWALDGIVQLKGYVPEDELDRAIVAAELAINLRWPSVGEASAAQLRIWRAGRTALVSNTGWYAGLPPDAAFFVSPEHEVEDIRRHLKALKADPQPFWRSGARARELLETRHRPQDYAASLVGHAATALAHDESTSKLVGSSLGRCLAEWPSDATHGVDLGNIAARLGPPERGSGVR